jgi:hypothetical protein
VVYSPRHDLERVARKEIAGFVYSIGRSAPREQLHPLLECFIKAYPDRTRMKRVLEELRRFGTIPVYGWLKLLPFVFPFFSKYRKSAAYLSDFDAHAANRGIS